MKFYKTISLDGGKESWKTIDKVTIFIRIRAVETEYFNCHFRIIFKNN